MSQDSENFFDLPDTPEPSCYCSNALCRYKHDPECPTCNKKPDPASAPAPLAQVSKPGPLATEVSEKQKFQMIEIKTSIEKTEEQKALLDAAIVDACLYGTDAAALICHGDGKDRATACPFLLKCPIFRTMGAKALPLDEPCPVEKAIMMNFIHMVAREMEIDPGDPTYANDLILIQQRAGLKLMMHRASIFMSDNPALEKIVETDNGRFKTKLITGNMNLDYIMKGLVEDRKLADSAVTTRKSKAQLMKGGFKDKSKQAADVQARIRKQIEMTEKTVKLDPVTGVPIELIQTIKYSKEDPNRD